MLADKRQNFPFLTVCYVNVKAFLLKESFILLEKSKFYAIVKHKPRKAIWSI